MKEVHCKQRTLNVLGAGFSVFKIWHSAGKKQKNQENRQLKRKKNRFCLNFWNVSPWRYGKIYLLHKNVTIFMFVSCSGIEYYCAIFPLDGNATSFLFYYMGNSNAWKIHMNFISWFKDKDQLWSCDCIVKETLWNRSEKVDHLAYKYWCVLQGSGIIKMIRNLAQSS